MCRYPSLVRSLALTVLVLLAGPASILAQQAPPEPLLVPQPPEFAAVRARFENMTPKELASAGYVTEPVCVNSPMGGMGFHSVNRELLEAQFRTGNLDAQNPPLLLLDGTGRVVGLEWEAAASLPQPVLFGQPVPLLPGHPGLEEPHYMLHAYFRPDGQVLFALFDPQLVCPPGTAPGA